MDKDRILAALRNPIRWLTKVDPTPGLTVGKIVRLMLKAFLFAITVQILVFSILKPLQVPYMNTFLGQFVVALLVYLPFIGFINQEFKPAPRKAVAKTTKSSSYKSAKTSKAKKYAGVKSKGPRLY